MMFRLKEILKRSIQVACVMHCTFEYLGDFVVCSGPSMEPTLYTQNILLTERVTTRWHNHKRGDIVIAISPTNPAQQICKRIVGLPGDKIMSTIPLSEKSDTLREEVQPLYIPRGYIWIEGDNRENSSDSRYYGPIPLGLVKSRVLCRLWPINSFRLLT